MHRFSRVIFVMAIELFLCTPTLVISYWILSVVEFAAGSSVEHKVALQQYIHTAGVRGACLGFRGSHGL